MSARPHTRETSTVRMIHPALALFLLAGAWILPGRSAAAPVGRVEPALERQAAADPEARVAGWVYFTDRAGAERSAAAVEEAVRRLPRRATPPTMLAR